MLLSSDLKFNPDVYASFKCSLGESTICVISSSSISNIEKTKLITTYCSSPKFLFHGDSKEKSHEGISPFRVGLMSDLIKATLSKTFRGLGM